MMGLHLLIFDRKKEGWISRIKQFTVSCAVALVFILPWVIYARPLSHNAPDWQGASYSLRLAMFFWKVNTWIFPFLGLVAVLGACALLNRVGVL
jgi:hypothetical protein